MQQSEGWKALRGKLHIRLKDTITTMEECHQVTEVTLQGVMGTASADEAIQKLLADCPYSVPLYLLANG